MGEGLFQPTHLLLILIVAMLLFGPKKLPELGKALGESIRGFKQAINSSGEDQKESNDSEKIQNRN